MDTTPTPSGDKDLWSRIIATAMAMPGAKVDREGFLTSQLRSNCEPQQLRKAIESRPAVAGVSPEWIDKLADACIKSHTVKAAGISFATGLPGGWAVAATIPVDVAQFYWHAIVMAQKLAYLYGWPVLFAEGGEVDEETKLRITMLIGMAMGADTASKLITEVSERLANQALRRIPGMALTKTAYYPLIKEVGKWIGIRVTKVTVARGVSRVVPVVGGAVSAGITVLSLTSMANRLKSHLGELRWARLESTPATR